MRLFSRNGLYGVEYFQSAFVVYNTRAIFAAFTARASRENDGVHAAEYLRERRDGRMFQAEDERGHGVRDRGDIGDVVLCADDRRYGVLLITEKTR